MAAEVILPRAWVGSLPKPRLCVGKEWEATAGADRGADGSSRTKSLSRMPTLPMYINQHNARNFTVDCRRARQTGLCAMVPIERLKPDVRSAGGWHQG